MYMTMKHFKYFLEGRSLKIVTDQNSMIRVILVHSTNLSSRQSRYFNFIANILLTLFIFLVQRLLLRFKNGGIESVGSAGQAGFTNQILV